VSDHLTALAVELRSALETLVDLRAELAALAVPDGGALDDEHDSEGSTVGFERARVASLIVRVERRVSDLLAAQRRMEEGSYRLCDRCQGAIPDDRLAALPATRLCVQCAGRLGAGRPGSFPGRQQR
jgi:DnaK suppressor protein